MKVATKATCSMALLDKQDNQMIEQVKQELVDHSRPLKTVAQFDWKAEFSFSFRR